MGVLFSAPQAEFEIIREEWLKSVHTLAARGVFVGGPSVTHFEKAFAEYCGVQGAVGVGNGTDALFLALKTLGVGQGDEVITAANTFIATVEAIHHAGARPVLVDCGLSDFLINLNKVKLAVTARTKVIIPVHLFGQMVDMQQLIPWAMERGIAVLEDSAQAAGARINGRASGSYGVMGCFSFYPDKNLGALGDGGAITASSPELISLLGKLRNHGGETRYQHEVPGFNSRLDPIQASALGLKLRYLDEWSVYRRKIARMYETYLENIGSVIVPFHRGDESHVFHLYVVRVDAGIRDELRKHLQKKGILTAIQYPRPVHLTPAFAYLGLGPGSFPNAELLSEQMISLPMHIAMTEAAVASVAAEVKKIAGTVQI